MVTPQTLLGAGVGLALAGLGGYVAWLWRRLDRLEERAAEGDHPEDPTEADERQG